MADTFVQNESIETVIQRYKGTVYSVALSYVKNRDDADDIFQEVLDAFYGGTPDKRTYQERGLDCQTIGPGFSLADWHVENRAI